MAKPTEDDDFPSSLDEVEGSKSFQSPTDDEYGRSDDLPPATPLPKLKPVTKKKNTVRRSKSTGSSSDGVSKSNWSLGTIILTVLLCIGAGSLRSPILRRMLAEHFGPILSNQFTSWKTFKHPRGGVQVDMLGTPALNSQVSVQGVETYSLFGYNEMSLMAMELPAAATIQADAALVKLLFDGIEEELKREAGSVNARVISSQRMTGVPNPGMELKLQRGSFVNVVRCYLASGFLVQAEFVSRNESASAADRDRFFNSLRGPNGQSICNSVGPATAAVPVTTVPSQSVPPQNAPAVTTVRDPAARTTAPSIPLTPPNMPFTPPKMPVFPKTRPNDRNQPMFRDR